MRMIGAGGTEEGQGAGVPWGAGYAGFGVQTLLCLQVGAPGS